MPSHRDLIRWAMVGLLGAAVVLMQWHQPAGAGLFAAIEHLVRDPLHQLVASDETESRVVVVDIDEPSIASVGPWPWQRARIADLLETLASNYGARAIGVDIVFPSAADASGDARLAALGQVAPVVFAQAFDFVDRVPALVSGLPVFDAPKVGTGSGGSEATGYVANHPGLALSRCVGNIGLLLDADGRVRRVPLIARWQGSGTPLLPVAMLACPLQSGPAVDAIRAMPDPAAVSTSWEVPFARRWESYTVIPARAVLDGSAPADLLRGRWVLVGSSALGLNDRAATPLSGSVAGVMVHAAALSALLDQMEGHSATLPFDGRWLAALWTLATLAAGAWALGRFKAWWLIPGAACVVLGWLAFAAWLLRHQADFSASAPLVAYALMVSVICVELWMTQREQGQILRSFATYVAPSVLEQMLRRGLDNPMVPQHGEITVISADMQDYTGLTNRLGLQEAAQLTREFLQCLTEPILAHNGTLDKYTGDGLVAFWGAPLPTDSHAQEALRAAQAMISNVREWNERRALSGRPPARVRVGVESGHVLVGDLGTRFRRTYTAVGDCINTASKLQAAAKTLGCDLVVGPVAARLAGRSGLIPVAQLRLPGHHEASVLWSFPSLRSTAPPPGAPAVPAVHSV